MSENEKTIQFLLMLVRRKQVEILEINERFKTCVRFGYQVGKLKRLE